MFVGSEFLSLESEVMCEWMKTILYTVHSVSHMESTSLRILQWLLCHDSKHLRLCLLAKAPIMNSPPIV